MIELLLVIGMIAILGTVGLVTLLRSRNETEVRTTGERITALLREAQSRSVSQASSTSWGVHFENGASPFYALYGGAYSTSSAEAHYALPATLDFATATIPENGAIEISFAQLSGLPSGSSTVRIHAVRDMTSSATISVASSGAVGY